MSRGDRVVKVEVSVGVVTCGVLIFTSLTTVWPLPNHLMSLVGDFPFYLFTLMFNCHLRFTVIDFMRSQSWSERSKYVSK